MANKKVFTALVAGSVLLLSACAQTVIPGLGLEKTDGFEGNRDSVVIEAVIQDSQTGKFKEGNVTVYQDQLSFDGNSAEVKGEETFYKVVSDQASDLAGHQIRVTVQSQNPEDYVFCGIAPVAKFEPLHNTEAQGEGSATCVVQVN